MTTRNTTHRIPHAGLTHFIRDTGDENAPVALLLHGFPDSSLVWSSLTPFLVAKVFRVVAPDLRGFGQTDMAPSIDAYDIQIGAMPDILAIMDALDINSAHVVGHDFGAPVAWALAAQYPERFKTLTAISVGHFRAFLGAGFSQKWRSTYILYHQLTGLCEATYRFNNWALLRKHWSKHGDIEGTIKHLTRPGRLTAGLNWYRANMPLRRIIKAPEIGEMGEEIVRIPTLGIWSDGDAYLTEHQMVNSAEYVDAPWRYEKIENASHWISYDRPEALSAILIEHWQAEY